MRSASTRSPSRHVRSQTAAEPVVDELGEQALVLLDAGPLAIAQRRHGPGQGVPLSGTLTLG